MKRVLACLSVYVSVYLSFLAMTSIHGRYDRTINTNSHGEIELNWELSFPLLFPSR